MRALARHSAHEIAGPHQVLCLRRELCPWQRVSLSRSAWCGSKASSNENCDGLHDHKGLFGKDADRESLLTSTISFGLRAYTVGTGVGAC